jgi:hypothetical protein
LRTGQPTGRAPGIAHDALERGAQRVDGALAPVARTADVLPRLIASWPEHAGGVVVRVPGESPRAAAGGGAPRV